MEEKERAMISSMKAAAQKMLIDFEKTKSITHNLTKGEARESSVLENFLKPYLPSRYSIGRGIIVDIEDNASKQQDLVIFDAFNSPILENLESSMLFFPESVFATIEVKSLLTKNELEDVLKKSISVWELKRTVSPSIALSPGIIVPSYQIATLCMGFCYHSKLTIEKARDELRNLRQTMPNSHALSLLCILQDRNGKAGLVINVSAEELTRIVTIPSPTTRLAVIECDSAGDALLYTYLILMEHLRGCGTTMPIPNLIEYAKAGGIGSPELKMAKEDIKGAFVSVEGKRLSTDTIQNMTEWTKKLFNQQISDDDLLELFYHLPELPSAEVLLDHRSVFKEHGQPVFFASTRTVYDAVKRHKEGKALPQDKDLLGSFITFIRTVIAQKSCIEMGP